MDPWLRKHLKWYRLVRRFRLHRVGMKLLLRAPGGKRETMTAEEARRVLQAVYPPRESSCVLPAVRNWPEASCDLTVIVPVYNNGEYIEECVRSVLDQETDYSVEVIVVNDGSTDDTAKKLAGFGGCPSVRIISRENGGVSVARNTALDQARGRCLMFLDGDDYLLPGAIQALMRCAEEHHAAIVEGNYTVIDRSGEVIRRSTGPDGQANPCEEFHGFVWGKVYERKLWDRLHFPPHVEFEDSIITQVLLEQVGMAGQSAFRIAETVNHYRMNRKGFSLTFQDRPCSVDTVWITELLMRDRQTLGMPFTQSYYEHLLDMARLSWERTELMPREVRRAVFVMYRHFLFDHPEALRTAKEHQKLLEQAFLEGSFRRYELMCAW